MNEPIEVLITSESNGSLWTCCAWDIRTGTNLMTYKGGGSANNHGLCMIKNEFIITANATKPLLHVWPINSQDQVSGLRFVVPGKVNSLAISPDGNYLLAGIQEILYIWQICSGRMLNSISKHYQSITTIKFTSDGSHFITAGQDGMVLVWNLTKTIGLSETNQKQQQVQPFYTFNEHALPVTDLHIGKGGIRAYMCSVSLDRTCLIYDLSSGTMLLKLVFEEPLTSVIINPIETLVYVGTNNGSIYEFSLISSPRTKEYHLTDEDYTNKFSGHTSKITALVLSVDGETLISGSADENVYIWHISSRQLLRSISHKGSITNLYTILGTKDIFNPEIKFNLIANNLKRMMESINSEDNHVVEIMITKSLEDDDNYEENDDSSSLGCSSNLLVAADTSQEIEKLRNEIYQLKKANKELFEYSVKNVLTNK